MNLSEERFFFEIVLYIKFQIIKHKIALFAQNEDHTFPEITYRTHKPHLKV